MYSVNRLAVTFVCDSFEGRQSPGRGRLLAGGEHACIDSQTGGSDFVSASPPDHGGYELKEYLVGMLRDAGHEVLDFGDEQPQLDDDYPDSVVPLARAIACGEVERGVGHLWKWCWGIGRRQQSGGGSRLPDS